MLCPKCGADAGDFKFCPECGAPMTIEKDKLSEAEPVSETNTESNVTSVETGTSITPNYSEPVSYPEKKPLPKKIIAIVAALVVLIVAVLLVIFSKPNVVKISAEYKGDTSELIKIDEKNNGIIVTGEKKNGKKTELSGWKIENPKELKADETASVVISYKELKTKLNVKCSTSKALKISASYDGGLENKTVVSKDQIKVIATLKNGEEVDVSKDCLFDPETVTLETDGEYVINVTYIDPVSQDELENKLKLTCSTLSIKSISATYSGKTSAGTLIDENNKDITVTAELKNGTKKTLDGWKITNPAELKEDSEVTVEITYDKYKCKLKVICSDMSESKYKSLCKSISYDALSRNPGKYESEYIKVTGTVFQVVSEADNVLEYSVYFIRSNGNLYMVRIDNYGTGTRILEDDTITVWGTFDKIYTYETVRGNANSVPQMTAEYWS